MGGPSGKQTFPWCCAPRESLITIGTSTGQIFQTTPGLFTVHTSLDSEDNFLTGGSSLVLPMQEVDHQVGGEPCPGCELLSHPQGKVSSVGVRPEEHLH